MKQKSKYNKVLTSFAVVIVVLVSILGGALSERLFGYKVLDKWFPKKALIDNNEKQIIREVLQEENAVIDVVEKVTPSVVTIGVKKTQKIINSQSLFLNPFDFFGKETNQLKVEEKEIEQDIGSGFIITQDGLVVTNKHVVSDLEAEYRIITSNDEELKVEKIYRDPVNDMAILKVTPPVSGLRPVSLGDSSNLKVGQVVIAIGTALGEFRSTVTTGVISGLGRGINAGGPFGGLSERLDNVIQTDAAINLGNSGGPLLNSLGQVIGVNVAMSQAGENIGFAIPINIVKESIDNFNTTGKFSRPYLGVRYQMLSKKIAILNSVPEGAYVVEVIENSPAEKAGIKDSDIILKIGKERLTEENGLAEVVGKLKIDDEVELEIYRGKEEVILKVKLEEAGE